MSIIPKFLRKRQKYHFITSRISISYITRHYSKHESTQIFGIVIKWHSMSIIHHASCHNDDGLNLWIFKQTPMKYFSLLELLWGSRNLFWSACESGTSNGVDLSQSPLQNQDQISDICGRGPKPGTSMEIHLN